MVTSPAYPSLPQGPSSLVAASLLVMTPGRAWQPLVYMELPPAPHQGRGCSSLATLRASSCTEHQIWPELPSSRPPRSFLHQQLPLNAKVKLISQGSGAWLTEDNSPTERPSLLFVLQSPRSFPVETYPLMSSLMKEPAEWTEWG
jgi:hypothetical protein